MCVIARTNKQIAVEDIPCYKVLQGLHPIFMFTPFNGKYIPFWIINGKYPLKANLKVVAYRWPQLGSTVYQSESGIHVYNTYESIGSMFYNAKSYYHIYECIIPKGSEYIRDSFEMVSSQIIFKRKIQ